MRICAECKHQKASSDRRWPICTAPAYEHESRPDPVTGEPLYLESIGIGIMITTRFKHPPCRDINTVNDCAEFAAKKCQARMDFDTEGQDYD